MLPYQLAATVVFYKYFYLFNYSFVDQQDLWIPGRLVGPLYDVHFPHDGNSMLQIGWICLAFWCLLAQGQGCLSVGGTPPGVRHLGRLFSWPRRLLLRLQRCTPLMWPLPQLYLFHTSAGSVFQPVLHSVGRGIKEKWPEVRHYKRAERELCPTLKH